VGAPPAIAEQVLAARQALYAHLKSLLKADIIESWSRDSQHLPVELNGIGLVAVMGSDLYQYVSPYVDAEPFDGDGAGIIMRESDGRVWTVSPANQYGGYLNTFPKGRMKPGETPQETAVRETWEETGLVAAIDEFLGDFQRFNETLIRYYLGHRIGGAPWAMGAESERVNLVPPTALAEHLKDTNGDETADHQVLATLLPTGGKVGPGNFKIGKRFACHAPEVMAGALADIIMSKGKNASDDIPASKESVPWSGGYRTGELDSGESTHAAADLATPAGYRIHDLDPTWSRAKRIHMTAHLMVHEEDPELTKDIEAAAAYSPCVQWSKAVSDASHEYLEKGEEGLAGWLLARGTAPEYRFSYDPDHLRIDGEPMRTSGEIAARAAKRLVEHIRAAPEREITAYRGLHGAKPIEQLELLKAGDTVPLDRLVSFSTRRHMALHFAERGKALNHEYLLKLCGLAKGVALDALANRDQGEFVTQGEFQVEKVEKEVLDFARPSALTYPVQRVTLLLRQVRVY
jgi:8-oxo-dGTP pyrophosphatase MutT (NUDIX family)